MKSRPQLFCFTYAGGTSTFFDVIEEDINGIELIGLEYAGHGSRHKEPFYQDFDELADDLFRQLVERYSGGEYGLFGYSMGSISLIEVLRRILSSGMRSPAAVFLAAHEPHTQPELSDLSADELDMWVKNRTIRFGDVPEKLLDNGPFWRTYLPVYRADYMIIGRYRFEEMDMETDIPAAIFYSEEDTPLADMEPWKGVFTKECSFYQFPGPHFFIREHHREMGNIIRAGLGVSV